MSKSYETIIQENEDKKLNKYLEEYDGEESLCDSCENDCYDESMIVDACSRYVKLVKKGKKL